MSSSPNKTVNEKAKAAMDKGSDVTVEDVQESVDADKASDSVDEEKLIKAFN